jgi:spermidine/putrescine transport system permease protein
MGFYTLLLAHISFTTPYVVISVLPRLRNADESQFEAALDLGASPGTAFWKVLMPQIKPGMITGAMIAFTLSIDDVIISFFTAGQTTNLSIMIFSMSRIGVNPRINALSTIMFIVVMVMLYVINAVDSKQRKNMNSERKLST